MDRGAPQPSAYPTVLFSLWFSRAPRPPTRWSAGAPKRSADARRENERHHHLLHSLRIARLRRPRTDVVTQKLSLSPGVHIPRAIRVLCWGNFCASWGPLAEVLRMTPSPSLCPPDVGSAGRPRGQDVGGPVCGLAPPSRCGIARANACTCDAGGPGPHQAMPGRFYFRWVACTGSGGPFPGTLRRKGAAIPPCPTDAASSGLQRLVRPSGA